ncbi:phage tail terminator family protein [Clostridium rectalis]|uniref:phage tail terminator family protein n=1 Tax=Clostridium rectalis TaxID=2040295 RepID=UPI000F642492|nr:hypothetical protein [Clostridium rectalis]
MKKLLMKICEKINGEFEYPTYIEEMKEGIKAPSFFIYIISNKQEERSKWTYEENTTIQIMYFVDPKALYKRLEQIEVMERLKKLFLNLFIKVEDEKISIKDITVDYTQDKDIFMQITLNKIGFEKEKWYRQHKDIQVMKKVNIRESGV